MEVWKNDNVRCEAILDNGDKVRADVKVIDEDIVDANEEHYTWFVQ